MVSESNIMDKMDVNFLEKLFDEVVKIAKEDNVVTPDEQALLEKTQQNIEEFKKLYDKAMEDNVITEEEYSVLEKAYKKIYSETQDEAFRDEILTKDEVKIISKIAHTLFTP